MGEFKPYNENKERQPESPEKHRQSQELKVNQATDLTTDEWHRVNLPQSEVQGLLIEETAVPVDVKINDKQSAPSEDLNPGEYFPGRITDLWVRNSETYPSSLDTEILKLTVNPTGPKGEQPNGLVKTLKQIFQGRHRYAKATSVNALITELDIGKLGGGETVEFWAYPNNYDTASTPKITMYGSNTPLEDGDAETGENGVRFLGRWDYETELTDTGPLMPVNSKGYFNVAVDNAYRYVYLAIDFGEDSGSDLYGDAEIEITARR